MSRLTQVALTVTGNEKANWLVELDEKTPDQHSFHRYQRIAVLRDGNLAEFRRDLGDVKGFRGVDEILIPSAFEHSVDELMDIADEIRGKPKIDIKDWLKIDKYILPS